MAAGASVASAQPLGGRRRAGFPAPDGEEVSERGTQACAECVASKLGQRVVAALAVDVGEGLTWTPRHRSPPRAMEETVPERTSEIELPMPETSPRTGERWTSTSAKHARRFEMLTAPIARTAPTMSRWTRWSVMLAPTLGTGQVTSATWRRTCANGSTTTRATMPPRIDGPQLATDPTPLPTALPPQRSDHGSPANSTPRSRPPGPRPTVRGEPSRGSRGSQHTAATSSTCPHARRGAGIR